MFLRSAASNILITFLISKHILYINYSLASTINQAKPGYCFLYIKIPVGADGLVYLFARISKSLYLLP